MNRRVEHNDWTEALKESLQDFSVAPSEGAWERLEADSAARKKPVFWWPATVVLAAASVVLGLFLFSPSGQKDNITSMTAEAELLSLPELPEVANLPSVAGLPDLEDLPEVARVTEPTEPAEIPATEVQEVEEVKDAVESAEVADAVEVVETVEVESETEPSAGTQPKTTAPAEKSVPAIDPFRELKPEKKKVRRASTIGFNVGTGLIAQAGTASVAPSSPGGPKKTARRYDISELLQHEAPSSFGIQFFIPLSERLHLETGVDLTSLHSSFGKISQDLEFAGLPLRVGYSVFDWDFADISVNTGALFEKCLSAVLMDQKYMEPQQWSASVGAIARCRLFGPLHLYAMPQISYYFTKTNLPTYRNSHPLTFSFVAGISFDL